MSLQKMALRPGLTDMKTDAIILAGGFGTRLKGVVDDLPKPMAITAGKPFLTYLLEQLNDANCTKAVLAVGYMHEVIINHFGKKYKSVELEYSIEDKPLGTGGAILNAVSCISSPGFLVLNGDSLFKIDLADFERKFNEKEAQITIALKRLKDFDR
jgi:D-glycero-alpha-D-manno-heptose 1-phosphate guanylyltransferase